jgi:hypothetical protein
LNFEEKKPESREEHNRHMWILTTKKLKSLKHGISRYTEAGLYSIFYILGMHGLAQKPCPETPLETESMTMMSHHIGMPINAQP